MQDSFSLIFTQENYIRMLGKGLRLLITKNCPKPPHVWRVHLLIEEKKILFADILGLLMMVNMEVPDDLVSEILLRLPVKTLVPFKCVCKTWLGKISDSGFHRNQLNHTNDNSITVIMINGISKKYRLPLLLGSRLSCSSFQRMEWDMESCFGSKDSWWPLSFESYCDGILCYTVDSTDLLLWIHLPESARDSQSLIML